MVMSEDDSVGSVVLDNRKILFGIFAVLLPHVAVNAVRALDGGRADPVVYSVIAISFSSSVSLVPWIQMRSLKPWVVDISVVFVTFWMLLDRSVCDRIIWLFGKY